MEVRTYGEQAKAYIKSRLLDGTLKPGDPIRECEIARALGISRGPVREALQSLSRQGLVTGLPQKAKYIRKMTPREIEESYRLGGALEGMCVTLSLDKWDERAVAVLGAILREMKRQSETADGLASMSQIDENFHDAVTGQCDNRLMVNLARDSCAHISKFLYYREWNTLFTPAEFYRRHEEIYATIKSRDPLAIQAALLEHYAESGRRLGKTTDI